MQKFCTLFSYNVIINTLKSAEHKNEGRNSAPCSMCNFLCNLNERKRIDLSI